MSKRSISYRVFFVHVLLFSSLLLASFMAEAQVHIVSTLQCKQPANAQVSPVRLERSFDFRLTESQQVMVTYSDATRGNGALLNPADTIKSDWTMTSDKITASWQNQTILHLALFEGAWSGVLIFPEGADASVNPFGEQIIELACGIPRW